MTTQNLVKTIYKCVLLVRKDIKMSNGKIVAQCGHGISYAVRNSSQSTLDRWCNNGEKIVTLGISNEKKMLSIYNDAIKNNLVTHIVCDAGHTEIEPGTNTVCVIGPDTEKSIDKLVKKLRLL